MPCFKTVKADKAGTKVENILKGYVAGTMELLGIANNGSLVKTYATSEYTIADDDITLPAVTENDGVAEFILKYKKTSANGVKILNSADKFPKTIKLTLKALAIDPCAPDVVRGCYIVMPSFQVSPETEFSLTTDSQLAFNGITFNYLFS